MKKLCILFSLTFILAAHSAYAGQADSAPAGAPSTKQPARLPDATVLYARCDTTDLFMDIYNPETDSLDRGITVLWCFGGGFKNGTRDEVSYTPWFDRLCRDGYRVVSIDYRRAMREYKGRSKGVKFYKANMHAIDVATSDLLTATAFICANAAELGIDPSRIVVSGSSAGAIMSLQAEFLISNSAPETSVLPEGFNYAGVMGFAGAVLSRDWSLRFHKEPCPVAMFHGTSDKVVNYGQLKILKLVWGGSDAIARSLSHSGWDNFVIYRFPGRAHEISASMMNNYEYEKQFLEQNVEAGVRRHVDLVVEDASIATPDWAKVKLKDL